VAHAVEEAGFARPGRIHREAAGFLRRLQRIDDRFLGNSVDGECRACGHRESGADDHRLNSEKPDRTGHCLGPCCYNACWPQASWRLDARKLGQVQTSECDARHRVKKTLLSWDYAAS